MIGFVVGVVIAMFGFLIAAGVYFVGVGDGEMNERERQQYKRLDQLIASICEKEKQ